MTTSLATNAAGILGVLDQWGERRPDDEFVICDGQSLSFREMSVRAAAIARGLGVIGLAEGDRVAIIAPNQIELVDLLPSV